jgi:hypothetical protein
MREKSVEINFFQECWARFKKPWCGSFTAYFIFVIVFFSAGGVVFAIFDGNHSGLNKVLSISSSVSTYFIALVIPSIINIILSFWSLKNKVSFIIYLIVGLVISFALLWLSNSMFNYFVFIPALIGVLLSWFLWVIANYDNELLNDALFNESINRNVKKNQANWDEE